MYKNSQNPILALQNMLNQNPNFKQVMDFINQNGGNPEQAFYALAKQRGVDPKVILQELGI